MCVFFISLPLYAQPSELFLKGQPLNIQSVVEFMVSSEWFTIHIYAMISGVSVVTKSRSFGWILISQFSHCSTHNPQLTATTTWIKMAMFSAQVRKKSFEVRSVNFYCTRTVHSHRMPLAESSLTMKATPTHNRYIDTQATTKWPHRLLVLPAQFRVLTGTSPTNITYHWC